MKTRVAVDAMGGDHGPSIVVSAVRAVLGEDPGLVVELVGDTAVLAPLLAAGGNPDPDRLQLVHAPETITMQDSPVQALKGRAGSSMRLALQRLAGGGVQACLSTGNTGALLALAQHGLGNLPGVERAAMCTLLPTESGHSYFLDVGASLAADAGRLVQYACMGAAMASALDGIAHPRVALLNVGSEAGKGTAAIQQADEYLRQRPDLAYQGFVEGSDLFAGKADVIACDGFAGNVALKASEGVARLIGARLRQGFARSAWLRVLALLGGPSLQGLRQDLDPEHFNGACLLGVNGIVVKSHGGASAAGVAQALRLSVRLARSGFLPGLVSRLQASSPAQ